MASVAHVVTPRAEYGWHRAGCTCGWESDRHAQLCDVEREVGTHLRRVHTADFDGLIARSSVGAAVADVKKRGIDAHLVDLEREMRNKHRVAKKKRVPVAKTLPTSQGTSPIVIVVALTELNASLTAAEDRAFMRGFGTALASIVRCHHDEQMVRYLIRQNNFTLANFQGIDMQDDDLAIITKAVNQ